MNGSILSLGNLKHVHSGFRTPASSLRSLVELCNNQAPPVAIGNENFRIDHLFYFQFCLPDGLQDYIPMAEDQRKSPETPNDKLKGGAYQGSTNNQGIQNHGGVVTGNNHGYNIITVSLFDSMYHYFLSLTCE